MLLFMFLQGILISKMLAWQLETWDFYQTDFEGNVSMFVAPGLFQFSS